MDFYQKYKTQFSGPSEKIGACLFDTAQYTSAATLALAFFTTLRNNVSLSNMQLAGVLPKDNAFTIRSVRFVVLQQPRSVARAASGAVQPGAIDNICQLINDGVAVLTVGQKIFGEWPLWSLPQGGGAFGIYSGDGDVADPGEIQDWATNGVPMVDNARVLSQPIFIPAQANFVLNVTWPAAITLAGGNTNLQFILDGELYRPIQ